MKRRWPKSRRGERGQALVMVMVLMLLGGIIIAPLLNHMSSGLKIEKEVRERRMSLLYAADSGVEDAFWKIQEKVAGIPAVGQDPWPYGIDNVNGNTITVTISRIDDPTFKINSVASGGGKQTTIESYIRVLDFSLDMNYAITSKGNISLQPQSVVNGNVHLNGNLDNKGTLNGEVHTDPINKWEWPTNDLLKRFYWKQVRLLTPFPNGIIDLRSTTTIGPLYRVGDLIVDNTTMPPKTATLGGTVYVTGNLTFAEPGGLQKGYTIDLNGQTIFVEGSIYFGPQFVSVRGPGCIIALGDVTFQPAIDGTNFIFVMSVNGKIAFQPNSSFYGSLAGETTVTLKPQFQHTWVSPPSGLNVPDYKGNAISQIVTWTIEP